ncbi:MAG: response regulator [Planctomycetes bacterium]|nr:response regulator [Planctomycetota bacterium]
MSQLKRILYVEDEPDIRAVAQVALEVVGGFELRFCSSGYEALEAVGAFGPDLILLDVMMPGMDGPSTLEALRREGHAVPVIFVTAKAQPAEVEAYRALGALDVIRKPFDAMLLAAEVRAAWEQGGE